MGQSLFEKETEQAYLAYLLHKGASGGVDLGLDKEDFYFDFHKKVFESITELIDQNIAIEPIAVINQLRQKKRFQNEEEETSYLMKFYAEAIIVHPLEYYIRRIKKFSSRRNYIKVLKESIQKVQENTDENEEVFTSIEAELAKVSRNVITKGLRPINEDKNDLIDYIKTMFQTKGTAIGLRTHINGLDDATTGLKPHELMIIAARPGNGKTTFALNVATNVALREKKTVAIFSLEMSRLELLIKMICSEARINSTNLKTGSLTENDRNKLISVITTVSNAPIYIDDSGTLSIWQFKSRIRQLLITTQLSLIIVDYLQLMSDPTTRDMGRQQEVASISRNLKQMAREANCPIIALSQMSRAVETRSKDQRPQLSDLRESGAIEQDADIVAFIYREELVKTKEEVSDDIKNKAEIIIAKNRSGPVTSFKLNFVPEYSRFDNL